MWHCLSVSLHLCKCLTHILCQRKFCLLHHLHIHQGTIRVPPPPYCLHFFLQCLTLSHLLPSLLLSQSLRYSRLEPALTLLRAWPPVQLLFMIALLTPSTFLLSRIHRFLFKFKGKKTKEDLITPDHRSLPCAVCLPHGG